MSEQMDFVLEESMTVTLEITFGPLGIKMAQLHVS